VETATNWYFSNHTSEKRKDYDCDGDGYLDGVMLIYAAPDYDTLNRDSYDNLWAYCFWIQDYTAKNTSNPGVNAYFWASYDFMYGQEVAYSRTGKTYHAGDTSHCTIDAHTYIHEMGHMFGLEDYYDYSNNSYQPAGGFSMQDHNVGSHDPFSSFALGWGKAYVPVESTTIDLKPFATDGEMIILSPSWNTYNSPFDEYLILEYFTDTGLNEFDVHHKYMSQYGKNYPTGSQDYGIRLWHVDARLLYTTTGEFSANKVTTNPIYPAGGVALMMSNTYYDGTEYSEAYGSLLGRSYANYNVLQMIRNSTSATYKPKDMLSPSSLFKAGDTFSMSKYSKQFVNAGQLNSKKDLGFTFEINACNSTYASITITKA
jgi:M6 family metalloprotease-like protein